MGAARGQQGVGSRECGESREASGQGAHVGMLQCAWHRRPAHVLREPGWTADGEDLEAMSSAVRAAPLPSGAVVFPDQQDNDPKHKSKLVQKWLQTSGIDVMDWPSYLPDLNPIENLWADVKRRAEMDNSQDVESLRNALQKAWDETDKRLIKKLIESMPRRLQRVREQAGWMTGY